MLPHDELYHYGTRGMRWGVHKALGAKNRSAVKALNKDIKDFKDGENISKNMLSKNQRKASNNDNSRISRKIAGFNVKLAKANLKAYPKYIKGHEQERDKVAAKAKTHAEKEAKLKSEMDQIRAAKFEAKLASIRNKPYNDKYQKRGIDRFGKAAESVAIGTATAVAIGIAKPFAEAFGKKLLAKVAKG